MGKRGLTLRIPTEYVVAHPKYYRKMVNSSLETIFGAEPAVLVADRHFDGQTGNVAVTTDELQVIWDDFKSFDKVLPSLPLE